MREQPFIIRKIEPILPEFVRKLLEKEFFKYIISGGIAFTCDLTVLVVLTEVFGLHYLVSNVFGYAAGLAVSYFINVTWVFEHRKYGGTQSKEFVYFTVIVFVGLAISEFLMYALTETVEIHYIYSKVVSIFFVFIFNYVVKKWLLFSPDRESS